MAILVGDHPRESVKVRHSPLASEDVTNNLAITRKRCKIELTKIGNDRSREYRVTEVEFWLAS